MRLAKDAQRLKNMQVSNLALLAAQSPREKPIFTPEQMAGHTVAWANDNIDDNPYLLVNPMRDAEGNPQAAGPIGYTKAPHLNRQTRPLPERRRRAKSSRQKAKDRRPQRPKVRRPKARKRRSRKARPRATRSPRRKA